MELSKPSEKKAGRPRAFDREAALEAAMHAFWAHGYETTSISDLSAAMGINAPAIYSAFGDKERLYLEAVERYVGDPQQQADAIRDAPTSFDAANMVLGWAIDRFTNDATPKGCLVASSLATGSEKSKHLRSKGTAIRADLEVSLTERIERDVKSGLLSPDANATDLAATIVCAVQGLSALARDGASRSKLEGIVRAVMTVWDQSEI